jgi:hypothetical protein
MTFSEVKVIHVVWDGVSHENDACAMNMVY